MGRNSKTSSSISFDFQCRKFVKGKSFSSFQLGKSLKNIGNVLINNGNLIEEIEIKQGDIIYEFYGEKAPCDIIILDAESIYPTQVKYKDEYWTKLPCLSISYEFDEGKHKYIDLSGTIEHKNSISEAYSFNGVLITTETYPLDYSNIIRKGSIIYSKYIVGIACFLDNIYQDNSNLPGSPILSVEQIKSICLNNIRVAIVDSKIFYTTEEDMYLVLMKWKNRNILSEYGDICLNNSLSSRKLLMGLILGYEIRDIHQLEEYLLQYNIYFQYLYDNNTSNEDNKFLLQIRPEFEAKKPINYNFIYYHDGIQQRISCPIVYYENEHNFNSNITHFRAVTMGYNTYLYKIKKTHARIYISWKKIDLQTFDITKEPEISYISNNLLIEYSDINRDKFTLHPSIKVVVCDSSYTNGYIDPCIEMSIGKPPKIIEYPNVFSSKEEIDNFKRKLHKWLYCTNKYLYCTSTEIKNIEIELYKIVGIKGIMIILPNGLSSISTSSIKNYKFGINNNGYGIDYNIGSVSQLQLIGKPIITNSFTMRLNFTLKSFPKHTLYLLQNGAYTKLNIKNTQLAAIPSELCAIQNLEKIEFDQLNSIPIKYQQNWKNLKFYLNMILKSSSSWNKGRIMLVGQAAVGKTTLVNKFKKYISSSQRKISKKDIDNDDINLATNGIEIHSVSDYSQKYELEMWDFGGQEIFYPTHQFFLSDKAIYLVLFKCTDIEDSRIEYWLKTIRWLTNNSTNNLIFLVGTHMNSVTKESLDNIEQYLTTKFTKQFYRSLQKKIYFIEKNKQKTISNLYSSIISSISDTKFLPITIPESWTRFYEYLNSCNDDVVSLDTYKEYSKICNINEEQIELVSEFLSGYIGKIVYLKTNKNTLDKNIILNPQWLANILSSVITFQHRFIKEGIINEIELKHILSHYSDSQREFIIKCLEKFRVLIYIRNLECYLAPSLLLEEMNTEKVLNDKLWILSENEIEQGRDFKFFFLPMGYIAQLIGRILLLKNVNILHTWRYGIIFIYNNIERVLITLDPTKFYLKIRVRFKSSILRDEIISLSKISYIVESTLSILYNVKDDTQVQIYIPCSHCLTENILNNSNNIEENQVLIDESNIHYFDFKDCVIKALKGSDCILCPKNNTTVLFIHTAPDVVLSFVDIINENDLETKNLLGKGGFGSVYKADYIKGDKIQQVAIKELTISEDQNISELVRKFSEFFSEISFMKQELNHDCIVQLYGIRLKPALGMVMELVDLGDLSKYISKHSQSNFSWKDRIGIAYDIAKAMEFMDSKQLVHRDLRTENILLHSGKHRIYGKLADFGLSRQLITQSTELGHQIWQYNPPERLEYNIYNIESDVYSYAICCWELVQLKIPYEELEDSDIYYKILPNGKKEIDFFKLKQDIIDGQLRPTLDNIPPLCPPEFINIIRQCWDSDKKLRPTFSQITVMLDSLYYSKYEDISL